MSRIRVRRPLLALIVLVVVLAVGYGVRALDDHGGHPPARLTPQPSSSTLSLSGRPG